jgi:hypothetical protein
MKKAFVVFLIILAFQSGKLVNASQISFNIEMVPWKDVNILLPKYSKFTVLDIETGKYFQVQRRAGSRHADVQPLTSRDTKIMKSIYGGKWSWKRRAIIVIHKDQWIAASMHGMPHGGGALKNNFPGHFCIHFDGSTTHRTNNMDLSHKLMILKAAGKLESYLWQADPYEVANAYIAGIKQQDQLITSFTSLQQIRWRHVFSQIENVKIARLQHLPVKDLNEQLYLNIPIEIDWFLKDTGRQTFKGVIHLVRFSQYDHWKVDTIEFFKENNLAL